MSDDESGFSRVYDADDMVEIIEEKGCLPIFVITDQAMGLLLVEPCENSRLKSEDEGVRSNVVAYHMIVAGQLLNDS